MTERMTISLLPEHVRIVERHGKKVGVKAFSVALQSLIHQFDQQQKAAETAAQPQADQPTPTAA